MRAKFITAPVGVLVLLSGLVGAVAPAQAVGVATVSAPGVPTHVVTSGATPRTINVAWTAPISNGGAAITDYSVEYRKVGESTWTSVQDGVSAATSATISGLSGSSLYEFRVSAGNSQVGEWSPRESVVAAGDFSSCAVMAAGSAQCWGDNTNLQLGHSGATYGDAAAQVATLDGGGPTTTVVSLAAGSAHSCAVLADGSAKCWGAGLSGRLGDGSGDNSSTPLLVAGLDGTSPGKLVVEIAAGSSHTCAVLGDGSAKCWGANSSGQLGNGTTDSASEPVAVTDLDGTSPGNSALSISAGASQSCAVLADGSAKCWGSNTSGRLGRGTDEDSLVPVLVSGLTGGTTATTVRSIATAVLHTCAVLESGAVTCWGANFNGQLGDGTTDSSNSPVAVPGIDGTTPAKTAISVSLGDAHTCALLATGAVKCWGGDDRNELGSGPGTSLTPVTVTDVDGTSLDKTAVALAVGGTHSCVVLATGATKCWGGNTRGELGSNTGTSETAPVSVPGLEGTSQQALTATGAFGATTPIEAPSAPTGVTAANPTTSSAEVSWTAPQWDGGSAITDYDVQYRVVGSISWLAFARVAWPATSVVVTGLASDTSYEFRVAAANVMLTGSYTLTATSTSTLSGGPGAPTNVVASAPTAAQIRVSWTAPSVTGTTSIRDYEVEYRSLTAQTWFTASHVRSIRTSMTVTGLTAGTTYVFRVAAVNTAGPGEYSAESNAVVTLVLPGAPGKPKIVTRSNISVSISWTAAAANGSPISNYLVEYQADGGVWKSLAPATYTTRAATITVREGSTYVFRISAISAAGTGPSSPVSLSALAASAPSAPIQLTAVTTRQNGEILVTWGRADANGAAYPRRYTVSWRISGGKWQSEIDPPKLWYCTITGLRKGAKYDVRVTFSTGEGSAAATKLGILVAK
ncbi:MAG: fibronectin type III domain-containing protein [Actinobacteria bacterium]|nr:fibronectin type III domain-containing protein [Actinomycetota bacterium]